MKIFKISTQKVTHSEIVKDKYLGDFYIKAVVNGRNYNAGFMVIADIIAVTGAREINSMRQTTRRIRSAIENHINK